MVVRTDSIEPNRAVIEAAAAWQAQLADEACDDESRDAFRYWLDADPSHQIAFDRMNVIAGHVARQTPVERTALELMLSHKRNGRVLALIALAGSAAMLTWWGSGEPSIRAGIAGERTSIGELHRARLGPGDSIVLDSDSAADIDEDERTVRLWRGGVIANVASNQPHPFIIRTPQGTARALGTRYSVRVDGDVTTVSVIESRVEACAIRGNRSCLTLTAGQSIRLDGSGASRIADIDPAAEQARGDGLLVADDRPLAEILDELNRYRRAPIRYAPEDIQGLRVSGTFPLTDSDRALASLKAALRVTIERDADGTTVRRR